MAATTTKTLLFLISSLLLLILTTTATTIDDDGEDITFLEEPKPPAPDYPDYADPNYHHPDPPTDDTDGSYEEFKAWGNRHAPPPPVFDEKDVVVLNRTNFEDFVNKTKHVMVEFYAPWCGYCQSLAPEYAAAATELKEGGSEVVLAKVDAMNETELADRFNVEGFPSLFLFSLGVPVPYNGDRTKDAIVSWLKKKTGHAVQNVTTTEEANQILSANSKLVVAFVDTFTGADVEELDAAAKLDDNVNFYQTTSPDVAKIFQIDPTSKRPALVLLKKEDEKLAHFDGEFSKLAISEFVSTNKLPLVINFTRETASLVFENPIKKQVLLFASSHESTKFISSFQEAAKAFKGKVMFIYVELDNEDYGQPVADYFGVIGDSPRLLAYAGNEDGRKFLLDGDITLDKIKSFAEDFLADKLKPYYRSDPIPEINDGDVKIVVGKNFEEIVLDESKDVLLEIYAPWCGHCHELEPKYNRLARYLRGTDSIVVSKMDGTRNEHPKAKADGFPTILFYPAGKKTSDPIIVDTERTAVGIYKFLKKHVSIPLKIQKPVSAVDDDQLPKSETANHHQSSSTLETTVTNTHEDIKDEL